MGKLAFSLLAGGHASWANFSSRIARWMLPGLCRLKVNQLVNGLTGETIDSPAAVDPVVNVAIADAGTCRPAAAVARRSRPRRVYLVPPARWKSARLAAHSAAMDWSKVPAPSSWLDRRPEPAHAQTIDLPRADAAVLHAPAALYVRELPAAVSLAMGEADFAKNLVVLGDWLGRRSRSVWEQTNRRRKLAAFSFCAAFGAIAVPLLTGVAHSQPEPEIPVTAFVPASAQAVVKNLAAPLAASSPFAQRRETAPIAAPPGSVPAVHGAMSSSSIALLSDVSTMDLMMPIAEPDLNIASHQSLWAQVGKQFGVDPLLLYSIALVESRSLHPGGDIGPTPWLFRVNDRLVLGERHHVQMEMAVASQLNAAVQDVGIMQVYYPMHRSAVRDPLTLLDPKTNISVAAKILHDGMRETRDPVLGVGYYHSHTPQLAKDYGTVVMTVYQRLKGVYRRSKNAQIVAR